MFGPLNFIEQKHTTLTSEQAPCPLCDDTFNLNICLDVFLKHLFEVHDLVIEDVQNVPKLVCYLDYWHKKFQVTELSSIVPSIDVQIPDSTTTTTTTKKYYLISTLMREDKELRQRLRLEHAMDRQEYERIDEKYIRDCLFCRLNHTGTRKDYLEHLSLQHNLQLGNPQNLVFVDELITLIETKLNEFGCIYCEKTFPDRAILKEHMRKKIHKRINPTNKLYDKFYIVNYTGNEDQEEVAIEPGERRNSDSEYSDWTECDTLITCLFCSASEPDINRLCLHMHSAHRFNFPQLSAHLDFYQRVKLVNYLRKQVHLHKCPTCDVECCDEEELLNHMKERCFVLPEVAKFDHPEYYFPTYENDAFLYYLEEVED